MDEPTSDMDPITRSLVYSAIKKLLAEQRSVILTSHTISEIEPICQRIAVLKDGQIIKEGGPEYLKSQVGEYYSVTLYLNNQRDDKFDSVKKVGFSRMFCNTKIIQSGRFHHNSIESLAICLFDSQ